MLAVLSPAKSLDFQTPPITKKHSTPQFVEDSAELIERLRQLSPKRLSNLMGISSKLADLNYERYAQWQPSFTPANAKQAALAFSGDVYLGLRAGEYSERDFTWAQKHLRILSGLHGVLKPLDLIQPYRLEMGTTLRNPRGKDLYDFWGGQVTTELNRSLENLGQRYLINLASKEYFSVVQRDDIQGQVIDVQFKDLKNGTYRFMSYFGKQARGAMASYMVRERVSTLKALKAFTGNGYRFSAEQSEPHRWVFLRDKIPTG